MNFILDWQLEELSILLAVKEIENKIENERKENEENKK